MDIRSFVRKGGLAASLAIASVGLLAACSTTEPQAASCYSGAEDTAAKQAAGCESYGGPIGTAAPMQAPQAANPSNNCYSGPEDTAAKQAAGCESYGGPINTTRQR